MTMLMMIIWQVVSVSLTYSFPIIRIQMEFCSPTQAGNILSNNTILLYIQLVWVFYTKSTRSPVLMLSPFSTWHCLLPLTEEKEGHIMIAEVAIVPLCQLTASALQKPSSPEYYAVPLPIAVPETSLLLSLYLGHSIRRKKWSSIYLSFAGRSRKNKLSLGNAPGSGQLFLCLSLVSREKLALWVTTAWTPTLILIHSLLWRKHSQYKKIGTCHKVCRYLSVSKSLATPFLCSKNSPLVGMEEISFPLQYPRACDYSSPWHMQSVDRGNKSSFPMPWVPSNLNSLWRVSSAGRPRGRKKTKSPAKREDQINFFNRIISKCIKKEHSFRRRKKNLSWCDYLKFLCGFAINLKFFSSCFLPFFPLLFVVCLFSSFIIQGIYLAD